ncbi:g13281 [Coccomyxa viridis]|uniref:G13281 protein n=1 Tax=Coccomyxa viridis TaxID=1274662 RepID=A0ABP1GF21_9CHLO
MQKVWQDLEVSESARQVALGEAMAQACHAWSSALSRCTQHRTEVAEQISALLDQTGMIADELGEASSLGSREKAVGSTIVAQRQVAEKQLAEWKERRTARLSQVEELQAEMNGLRSRVGLQTGALLGRQVLTQDAMEAQRIEIARLQEECAQRMQTLEGMLASLSAQCAELGEDLGALAAEAHPSLRGLRDMDGAVQGLSDAADLSDRTFKALDDKAARLRKLKAERRRQAGALLGILKNLCNVLEIKPDSVEQRSCISLIESAACVHTASLDKVKAEIEALHGRKAEAMRAMTQAQHRELEDICTASHMAVPPLPSTPSAEAGLSGAALCDQVAEMMAKVAEQVREAEEEAERRGPVLTALQDLASMRTECAWLASYEKDDARFKGRDANRNLQRSLKAGKVRERLPSAVQQLAGAVEQWQDERGSAFMHDGQPLQEVLSTMLEEIQAEARQRMDHHKSQGSRRGSDAGAGAQGGAIAFGRRQAAPARGTPSASRTPASSAKASGQKQMPKVPKLPLSTDQKTEGDVRPLSVRAELTPPLTARKTQNSRLKGLNEKVERLLQSCSPAQGMTTPASEVSQGSPHRRLHSPAMPFLDVTPVSTQTRPDRLSPSKLVSPLSVTAAAGKWDAKT